MRNTSQQTFAAFSDLIGSAYDKVNCWQLVKEFYRLEMGRELSGIFDESHVPVDAEIQNLIWASKGDFERVDLSLSSPQKGDILVFKIKGFESHIGVVLASFHFAHSTKAYGVVTERLSGIWFRRLSGVYRLKEEAKTND